MDREQLRQVSTARSEQTAHEHEADAEEHENMCGGVHQQERSEEAEHQRGGSHGKKHLLAAHLVTEVTEQHGAERTSQEGDSECGERHNLSQCRIGDVGEEDCAEVAGGCDGVTVVVIELDGSTHHRSGDDLRNRILLHGFRHGRSCTCRHNPFFSPHAAHKP